jgi:cytochrome c553
MRIAALAAMAVMGIAVNAASMAQTQSPTPASVPPSSSFPAWAYPWVPDFKVAPADDVPQHVPDSTASFTVKQERDLFFVPDWHPEDHPTMPDAVAHGRMPDVRACGSCHRAAGTGGPENASLAGLPAAYIMQQIEDYKSGARKFAGPQRSPSVVMTAIAKASNEEEIKAAAAYFSSLKPRANIKVVETDTVPVTQIARVFYMLVKDGGTEPIGQRIIETPVDAAQFEHRDTRSQFIAYVPKGSIAKGETLATTGGADITTPCITCHGPDLRGVAPIPGIAGRSPSYLVRQLYDFQQHARAGSAGAPMAPVVEKLSHDDMISLAAYAASLTP